MQLQHTLKLSNGTVSSRTRLGAQRGTPSCPPLCFQDKNKEEQCQQQARRTQGFSTGREHKSSSPPPKYSPEAPKVDPLIPAFTRRRELFAGRIAMVSFGLACMLEGLLPGHPGMLAQPWLLTGGVVEPSTVYFVILGIVAYNTERGTSLWGPTFDEANLKDVAKRPKGPPGAAIDPFRHPKQFLGISSWGFTKSNEIFHGRIAMVAFFAALVQGIRMGGLHGPGPVAQAAQLLHVPCDYGLGAFGAGAFVVCAMFIAAVHGRAGQQQVREEDVY